MTEHRPLYHACSGTVGPTSSHSPSTDQSPLVQHYANGTVASDTLLLLPILVSPSSYEQPSPCLQLAHLDNGNLGFCNEPSCDSCACCTAAVCALHCYSIWVALPDEVGLYSSDKHARLCETCFFLSRAMRTAIHAFVRAINGEVQL
jgi:hypothetical protein